MQKNTKLKLVFSGQVIKKREEMGLTQEAVAEYVSVSVRCLQLIEKGERLPSFQVALQLIALLDLDYSIFLEVAKDNVPIHTH